MSFGILASAHVPFAAGVDYSTEVLADSPMVYWRLGDSSGTTATDSSGNGRSGTYANCTLGAAGAISDGDSAATFNGTSSQCYVLDAAWMDTSHWSIELWFKTGASTAGFSLLASRATATVSVDKQFNIYFYNDDLIYETYFGYTGNTVTAVGTYNDGNWHHVVATWDGTTQALYVDGSLADSDTPGARNVSVGCHFTIGAVVGNALWFDGVLDELAWYDTALSSSRVSAHYAAA